MELLIYCAGGFGLEIVDLAKRINQIENRWNNILFIDDVIQEKERYGISIYSYADISENINTDLYEISIANGEPFVREVLYNKVKEKCLKIATLIDPSAIISDSAQLDEGVIIPANCFISSITKIGNNTTLNSGALIGHEVSISDNCVISSGVNIAGGCEINRNTYIGMGAQIKQGVKIGEGVIIGMGSVVYNDIPDHVIALGNPARPMKKNIEEKVFK